MFKGINIRFYKFINSKIYQIRKIILKYQNLSIGHPSSAFLFKGVPAVPVNSRFQSFSESCFGLEAKYRLCA